MAPVDTVSTESIETFPTMNWSAIIAGSTVALAMGVLLYLGGLALGLASIHAHVGANSAKAIGIAATIWTLLTWAGALFVGGLFASWYDGKADTMMGAMHGLSVWGLTIAITLVLLVFAGNGLHRRATDGPMRVPMTMENHGRVRTDVAVLHAQLANAVGRAGADTTTVSAPVEASAEQPSTQRRGRSLELRRDDGLLAVARALVFGEKANASADAKALLVARTRLSDADADRILQAAAPQVEKARSDAEQAATNAAHRAAAVAAVSFFALLLSMLTALLGGSAGANHIHKIYHLRTYTRTDTSVTR